MDFYGFSFNGHHSSEMGFIRTSDGNRYNENIGPNFQDKTIQIPGADGTYFFNSFYNQKPFTINIAFDHMTEEQLRTLRQVFNCKDVGPLIFDEWPYKAYTVKLQSPVQLKYICFDEPVRTSSTWIHNNVLAPSSSDDETGRPPAQSTQRIYKGEGTIQFIAYQPYAHSIHKYLINFISAANDENASITEKIAVEHMDEWQGASHMLYDDTNYPDTFTGPDAQFRCNLYNAGDIPTDCVLWFNKSDIINNNNLDKVLDLTWYDIEAGESISTAIHLDFDVVDEDRLEGVTAIVINTRTNLIEGYSGSQPTGRLYNDAILAGDFFKIPVGTSYLMANHCPTLLQYHYLYY